MLCPSLLPWVKGGISVHQIDEQRKYVSLRLGFDQAGAYGVKRQHAAGG